MLSGYQYFSGLASLIRLAFSSSSSTDPRIFCVFSLFICNCNSVHVYYDATIVFMKCVLVSGVFKLFLDLFKSCGAEIENDVGVCASHRASNSLENCFTLAADR